MSTQVIPLPWPLGRESIWPWAGHDACPELLLPKIDSSVDSLQASGHDDTFQL